MLSEKRGKFADTISVSSRNIEMMCNQVLLREYRTTLRGNTWKYKVL